jgi:type VI secretion system secreted protein VgrG
MDFTQANRLIAIDTPLGKDVLLLQSLSGYEEISRLFSFELELLAPDNDSISFKNMVGQNVTLTIQLPNGTPRYINGYVSRFAQGATDERFFTHYTAQVVPWLWFLTRQADCRIFQNMSVPDIISQVFGLFTFAKFRNSLNGTYPKLEYCVQYRETAFNFVSRLMEEYGIFYYFDHTKQGEHTLVLADSSSALTACSSSPASCNVTTGGLDDPSAITEWYVEQELRTGKYTVTDYNFTTPSTSLLAQEPTVVSVSPNQGLEIFDYPGLHTTKDQGETVAKVRMQEEEAVYMVATGPSNCRGFASGYTFELRNHDRADQNTTYVLTEVHHAASAGDTYIAGTVGTERYSNSFTCIPSSVTYRPRRITPKPFVQGPQPALVVGKSGEEIWTDKYGRVKVQFYWDRLGKKDENSSCWVRVSHPWAGQGWGSVSIPRMGQEVIVEFLEGDPDRPIIMGRVYNAEQMPPYGLPGSQVVSGLKTNSTKGGGGYNEMSMDDTKGKEKITIHAQYDMGTTVEHDETLTVKNDRRKTVKHDEKNTIQSNRTTDVVDGNETLTVKTGNRSVTVSTGNDTLTVSTGNKTDKIQGAYDVTVNGEHFKVVCGLSQLILHYSGLIEIIGNDIKIDAINDIKQKALNIESSATVSNNTKGLMVLSDAKAINVVKGGMVQLNP